MTPLLVESDCHLEQEVCVTTAHAQVQMHVRDWAEAQREDPSTECSFRLAGGTEEDRFESTFWQTMPPARKAD